MDDPDVLALVEKYIKNQSIIGQAYGMLNDPNRLQEVSHISGRIDVATKEKLDALCENVTGLMKAPLAAVTLINAEQQLVLGACGMSHEPVARDHSFCIFVAASGLSFELSDIKSDIETAPAYSERSIRAYLGRPIVLGDQAVGALCVVDFVPRVWTEFENMLLTNYAAHVSSILEERR